MKAKLLHKQSGQKTFALVFDTGDEVVAGLLAFAKEKRLSASHFTAIGAFSDVTLGYFDWEKKDYQKLPVREQVEALSLIGDVALNKANQRCMPTLLWASLTAQHMAAISWKHTCDLRWK